MIRVEDLEPGKEYWCSYIEFSRSSSRVNKRILPQKVVYEEYEKTKKSTFYSSRLGVFKEVGNNRHLFYTYERQEYIEPIYRTKEEAIDGYNSQLYNELDKVRSEYDSKVNNINKNFLKKD